MSLLLEYTGELYSGSQDIATAEDGSYQQQSHRLEPEYANHTASQIFFAMPLFNWSETSINNVANKHFWIYWAVTGPLTVAVVAGVASWAFLQSRRAERVAQLARRSTGIGFASDDEMEGTGAALTKRRGRGWFGIR
ncbi:hypothetical protein BJX68DRAFT_272650 [Aspergillus pseudodeflectus]|uniref:Uncharacterized protein n=1 Tax=Aspergillus pseudodeflectus TaxID=176178 RepID=A0ABR4JFE9_9EURO